MEKEIPPEERILIRRRISKFRRIKAALAKAHGRRIPRSLLGRDSGEDIAKEALKRSSLRRKKEDAKRLEVGINGHSYERALRWDEIMDRCNKSLDADLDPYFKRLRRITAKKVKEIK